MAKGKKRAGSSRKKKVDQDMFFVGVVALVAAAAVFYWRGAADVLWYGIPAVIGIALICEAYI